MIFANHSIFSKPGGGNHMQKILVSLISDQTIPNLLLIKELSDIDRYIFITTQGMEQKRKTDCIMNAAAIPAAKAVKIEVTEDSLVDIREKLDQCNFEDGDEFYVNLTGGTKIMSIGVYNFFKERKSEIYYIPIGKNIYRKIFPEVKNKEANIHYRVNITEYLKGYGIETVNREDDSTFVKKADYTDFFFGMWQKAFPRFFEFLQNLRVERDRRSIDVKNFDGLASFLSEIKFQCVRPGELLKKEIGYLTGGWFEEYVFHMLKKSLQIPDGFIAADIHIKRSSVQNQFDVMFMNGNALHVIECKTSVYDKRSEKNILNDSMYKLAALGQDFGLRVKSYLMTLSKKGKQKNHIKDSFIDRSKVLGIKIIDIDELTQKSMNQIFSL
jgi:hypothetical protein